MSAADGGNRSAMDAQVLRSFFSRRSSSGYSLWKFAVNFTTKKLESWVYTHARSLSQFDTISACVSRTDIRTDGFAKITGSTALC